MKLLPALLMRAFTRPHRPATSSRSFPTSASLPTSATKVSAVPPFLAIAAFTSSSLLWVRATRTVVAPSSASASAVERPMPVLAPVTTTTSPLNCNSLSTPASLSLSLRSVQRLACVFLVGELLQRRHHFLREQPDVLFGQIAGQGSELQETKQVLESKQAVRIHELLAHGFGAAADDDTLLDEAVEGVLLPAYRPLVAAHVLERLGRPIGGREQHLERQPQEPVEQAFDVGLGLLARLLVGVGDVDGGRPTDLVGAGPIAIHTLRAFATGPGPGLHDEVVRFLKARVRECGVGAGGEIFRSNAAHHAADKPPAGDAVDHGVLLGNIQRMLAQAERTAEYRDLCLGHTARQRCGHHDR